MTKRKEGAKKGRPTLYDIDQIIDIIADRMSKGETLKAICSTEGLPSLRRLQELTENRPDYRATLIRAREAGAEYMVGDLHDQMMDMIALAKKGETDKGYVDVMRLYSQHVQWLTARMSPKKFSERVLAEIAKVPEPVKEPEPMLDPKYLNYEERELYLQLEEAGRRRRESMLIEHEPQPQKEELKEEEEADGTAESAGHDQPSDPAS